MVDAICLSAGIIVGVALLAALAVAGTLGLLTWRRRRQFRIVNTLSVPMNVLHIAWYTTSLAQEGLSMVGVLQLGIISLQSTGNRQVRMTSSEDCLHLPAAPVLSKRNLMPFSMSI